MRRHLGEESRCDGIQEKITIKKQTQIQKTIDFCFLLLIFEKILI